MEIKKNPKNFKVEITFNMKRQYNNIRRLFINNHKTVSNEKI